MIAWVDKLPYPEITYVGVETDVVHPVYAACIVGFNLF